ncbi:MAG: GNAT family N-acetyltransferase [Microbacterium sp.]
MSDVTIRRVGVDEWERVRDLRIEAVSDPAASVAFMSTLADEQARDDQFWRDRTTNAAWGSAAAQFIAEIDGQWIGTVTALTDQTTANIVGVYLNPPHRGQGILAQLVDAAANWAREIGRSALTLDVHAENPRARAAYTKLGFAPTGHEFTSSIGPELQMRRPL